MRTKILGQGEPEHAVLYCVHGNEPCGKLAVDRIIHEEPEIKKPVKLVFANEKAFQQGVTHIDEDLNRVWHPQKQETHEEKLAKKIQKEIKGKTVLDIHSSFSHPEAFGLKTRDSEIVDQQMEKLGLKQSADIGPVYDSQIQDTNRIAVECGYTRSQQAIENAYNVVKNFLKANQIIEGTAKDRKPCQYRIHSKVEETGYQFTRKNFQRIEKGETYAIKGKEKLKASEEFYPVLMSTTGYDNMIGFKAKPK